MKAIFSGLEGCGKSLYLAMMAEWLVNRNIKWYKKTKIRRTLASNIKFTPEFEKACPLPIVYWTRLDELIKMKDCDVIIDEVGNYFDSRLWADLSLDVRRWLAQADKVGVEMYGSAQDFAQVDKSFRRLVTDLIYLKKVVGSGRPSATKPPIKHIWGAVAKFRLDPQGYEEDKKKYLSYIPSFFFIREHYCRMFDTTQEIKGGNNVPLRHIERTCEDENCQFHKIVHV